ncbi:cytochrome P450 [Nocardioides sp. zg-579]|uniref:Cytochrome P450 n=1 Tax=Nocardioides marmotae TaxID=2663857 RepID=A0A6I3JA57_9ACTN|nr:cytochrome P450 [Nocardioides marmotae]MCR6029885.1 cytochrome P450 [Gordonia jinghuaiqii]MTB93515.1 cytochrome P450 [Nocardioides marmotae]QKD99890.1 cytochrome P450 [Nocardioides marmotae]
MLTDPRCFDFPLDVSRRPTRRLRAVDRERGTRSPRPTSLHTTAAQVAHGRAVFSACLDEELRAFPDGSADLDGALLLRRPVSRATTSAVLTPLIDDLDEPTRDVVADGTLRWIDALAPVIGSRRNPSRWSSARRAEDRARRELERELAAAGVDDPAAVATVLAAGIQVPVAAGAWLLVHLAGAPAAASYEPAHVAWETLRVTPPTWMTARVALADSVLAGQTIRAGEVVLVSPLLLGQLPDLVPAVPAGPLDTFDPDRWRRDDVRPGAWLPFGAGPHACPGRSLGLALLTDLAARATSWDLEPAAGTVLDQSRGLFPVPAVVRARLTGAPA